jgi:hypothetical protein
MGEACPVCGASLSTARLGVLGIAGLFQAAEKK